MRAKEAEARASAAGTGKGGRNLPGTAAGAEARTAAWWRNETGPTSRQLLGEKIRQTLRGAQGQSVRHVIAELNPILRGWGAYFRLTEEKGVLEELDGWIRRKVRALLWRHWKSGYTRAQNLKPAGLSYERAWQAA